MLLCAAWGQHYTGEHCHPQHMHTCSQTHAYMHTHIHTNIGEVTHIKGGERWAGLRGPVNHLWIWEGVSNQIGAENVIVSVVFYAVFLCNFFSCFFISLYSAVIQLLGLICFGTTPSVKITLSWGTDNHLHHFPELSVWVGVHFCISCITRVTAGSGVIVNTFLIDNVWQPCIQATLKLGWYVAAVWS